jgi:hypothetical protein
MKYFFALAFAGFLLVSVYLLTKEKPDNQVSQKNVPEMLKRERSGKVSIVDFKTDDKGVEYKVSEEQLDEFANQVKTLKAKQPAGK